MSSTQVLNSLLDFYAQQEQWTVTQMEQRGITPQTLDISDSESTIAGSPASSPSPPPSTSAVIHLRHRKRSRKPYGTTVGLIISRRRPWTTHSTSTNLRRSSPPRKPYYHIHVESSSDESASPTPTPQSTQVLLQSFKTMLDAHAESCKRLELLVRDAELQRRQYAT